jgi:ribonuclease HII
MRLVLGVDEAGRGPLAGPVAVGVIVAPEDFDLLVAFPGLNDSKQLSEKKREELFSILCDFEKRGVVRYSVSFSSHAIIDRDGITRAVAGATARGIRSLVPEPSSCKVFLDGLLHAPPEYEQETVIHGDSLVPAIMLASVAAKVTRDHLMVHEATHYPSYGFERHKGYGTAEHVRAIRELGPTPIHRRTFLSHIVNASMPA